MLSFDHDEGTYTLVFEDEDGERHTLTFGTFEAVRLHALVTKQLDEYVSEMRAAWDSYRRGDGPNEEPAGTWETDTQALHGYRCCSPEEDYFEMMREQADLANKARRENA